MVDLGWKTQRLRVAVGGAVLVLAISGCTGATPSASPTGASSASATANAGESPRPSVTPVASVPRWIATGEMIEVGYRQTATLLLDGTVLVAGGLRTSGDWGSAELFDPGGGSWTATGSMLEGRADHTATLLGDGTVLVAGGYSESGSPTSAELFDPDTGRWKAAGNLTEARSGHTATLLGDGTVLVVGGGPASAELYDPSDGSWSATESMSEARQFHSATMLRDGTVLVVGGSTSCGFECASALASAELYDPNDRSWSVLRSMATPRNDHTATLLPDGTVLVAGGCCGIGYLEPIASAELYDPGNREWTATQDMTEVRSWHTATLLVDGTVLVAGGGGIIGHLSSAELYDPSDGSWSATESMDQVRLDHTATLLRDGTVLVVRGCCGSPGLQSSAELYVPDAGN